jgi:hypothetical protein
MKPNITLRAALILFLLLNSSWIVFYYAGQLSTDDTNGVETARDGYIPSYEIYIGPHVQSYINGEPVDDRELQWAVGFTDDGPVGFRPDGVIGKNTIEAVLFQNSLDDRFWENAK